MKIISLCLLTCLAMPLAAQDVQSHKGLWGGFGLGPGINGTEYNIWGVQSYGRIGGTLSQQVLLGGESAGWFGSENGYDLYRGNVSGIVLFYPSAKGGLFLKGGVGFSYLTTSYNHFVPGTITYIGTESSSGFGTTAGLGFDLRLGRNIYLVPELDWFLQSSGSNLVSASTVNVFAFTLGLVWH